MSTTHTPTQPAARTLRNLDFPIGAVLLLAIYILSYLWLPRQVFWSPDEGVRYMMAHELAQGGQGFEQANQSLAARFHPSIFNGPGFMYPTVRANGKVNYPWPILFPLLAGICERLLGFEGIYLLPLLSAWLSALLAGWIVRHYDPGLAGWAILVAGLCTPLYFYGLGFWDHTLTAMLALLAVGLLAHRSRRRAYRIAALALLGLASLVRVEMAVFGLAVLLGWRITCYIQEPSAKSLQKTALALFAAILLTWFIWISGLVPTRQRTEAQRLYTSIVAESNTASAVYNRAKLLVNNLPNLLINYSGDEGPPLSQPWTWGGVLCLTMIVTAPWVKPFPLKSALIFLGMLGLSSLSQWVLLNDIPFRALHGIFLCAPYLPIGFYLLSGALRRQQWSLFMLGFIAMIYLVLQVGLVLLVRGSSPGGLKTGLEWGARYFLPLYPLLAALALLGAKYYRAETHSSWMGQLFNLLALIAMLIAGQFQARGYLMMRFTRLTLADADGYLRAASSQTVITDTWWLPAALGNYYVSEGIYAIETPESLNHWLILAQSEGVEEFIYVSKMPFTTPLSADLSIQLKPGSQRVINGLFITHLQIEGGS